MAPRNALPQEVSELLLCSDPTQREHAWNRFLEFCSPLILSVARGRSFDYDTTMDRYAYVVQKLKSDDCRRLRSYDPTGPGKFTTWLTVVARRLCLDHHRHRYGRSRKSGSGGPEADEAAVRRSLADFVVNELIEDRTGTWSGNPATELGRRQLVGFLRASVADLPPDDQLLLSYRFTDGLSAREISQLMGFRTPFHVYRRVNRVLGILKKSLTKRGVDDALP